MKRFSYFMGLVALFSSLNASAITAAGGVELVQGLKVLVNSAGAVSARSEAAFVADMAAAGFKNAAIARTIYAGLQGQAGLTRFHSKMNLEAADWAKLSELAQNKSGLEVMSRVMASVNGKTMRVNYETLAAAFSGDIELETELAPIEVTDAEVADFAESFVPDSEGWTTLTALRNGDAADEGRLEEAFRLAVYAIESAPSACGATCTADEIKQLANLGVSAVGTLAANLQPLNTTTVEEALAQRGQFKNAPFHNSRYRSGLKIAGESAAKGALDEELEACLIRR